MAGIPETNEILETGLGSGKPYLGSPKVVESILREYLFDLTSMRSAQLENGSDPLPRVKELSEALQKVFYGEDERYQSYAWNKPESFGRYLVEGCGIGGETSDAVSRVGFRIAKEYLKDLVDHERDILDELEMQASVDRIIKKYTSIFMGNTASD